MSPNASFTNERMTRLKFSQLRRLLSPNNSDPPLGVAITITIPTVLRDLIPYCRHADAEEMSPSR